MKTTTITMPVLRRIIYVALLFAALLIGIFVGGLLAKTNSGVGVVVIENRDDIAIKEVSIKVCKRTYSFNNIVPGEYKLFGHRIDCESGYDLTVEYISGDLIKLNDGYFTPGGLDTLTIFFAQNKKLDVDTKKSVLMQN